MRPSKPTQCKSKQDNTEKKTSQDQARQAQLSNDRAIQCNTIPDKPRQD